METIFMKTEITDKLNLKNPIQNTALVNLSIYYTWKNIKSAYNNDRFKITAPTWNNKLDLTDGSYPVSDIQNHFEYIIKEHETIEDNSPIRIYIKKIKNRIVFIIKTGYYCQKKQCKRREVLKKVIIEDKDVKNVPKLEIVDVILMHCNVVNSNHQQASKVLFTFVPDEQFRQ